MDSTRFGGRAIVAAIGFFLVSGIEIARVATGGSWGELTFAGSNVALLLVPLWIAAGIGLVARKAWAWPLVIVAALALLGHAGTLGMAGDRLMSAVVLILGFAAVGSALRHRSTYGVRGYLEPRRSYA